MLMRLSPAAAAAAVAICFGPAHAQEPGAHPNAHEVDNGTDPTRVSRTLWGSYEFRDLGSGADINRFEFTGVQPLGAHASIRLTLPIESNNSLGDSDYDLGDVEVQLTKVVLASRTHAYVYKGEFTFDTAGRSELGGGQTVFEGTFIYARFLKSGIFAPSFAQSWGFDEEAGRQRINNLVVDFYYVPKLANPNWLMTVDPALLFDWERGEQSTSLGVQVGHAAGKLWGGHGQLYVKPTAFVGGHRTADWSVEVGYKLIGF